MNTAIQRALALLSRAGTTILALPIMLYRALISPWKPPTCRFRPTCSEYALRALRVHGPLRGTGLALWRILRCQPFATSGYDPVPPRRGHGAHCEPREH